VSLVAWILAVPIDGTGPTSQPTHTVLLAHQGPIAVEVVAPLVLAGAALASRRRVDVVAWGAAALVLLVAVASPVATWAERSVTGHMIQHLLVLLLVAPLIAIPLAGAPSQLRRTPLARGLARHAILPGSAPVIAGGVHGLAVIAIHLVPVYDAALSSWPIHGLEHVVLVATGGWWGAAVLHHSARGSLIAPVLSLFGVATLGALLGSFMMFARGPLYAHGDVVDQQIAGALMAGIAGGTYAVIGLLLVARGVRLLGTPRRPRMPVDGRVVLSVATLVVMASAGAVARPSPAPDGQTAASAAARQAGGQAIGQELYRRDCAWCHGVEGEGTSRGIGITDRGTASVYYALSTGRMPIDHPDQLIRRSTPAYTFDEIEALIEYTAAFVEGPEVPDLAAFDDDLGPGGRQYRLQCAACHGATGIGGALTTSIGAPSVLHSSRSETAAAIVAGPGNMPAFGSLADADVAAIAAYVEELQDPVTTGVALPGGRVTEGLVAWLAMLVVGLTFVAWVGRRA
jgi:ubiquinol-cytochrome c reductase cytochrome c subunit